MHHILLIGMFYVLSHPFFINGQEIDLSFNTSVYEGTNDHFYAHIGDDVVLTCTVRSAEALVYMDRGQYFSATYERLVANGKLVSDVANQPNKYSFQSNSETYHLTIHNLEKSDSLHYRCGFCTQIPRRCGWPALVQLEVKDTSDDSRIPDFCDLINNTAGVFFTGNDLILSCPKIPKLSFSIVAFNGSFLFSVEFEMEDHGDIFTLLTLKNLTARFNGTTLSCTQDGDINKNYCRHFPKILVFNEITVLLFGGEREITNGENVTFTCYSHPFSPPTVEWDILDSNVVFENMIISETDNCSTITFTDLQFHDSSSSRLTVFCNVTIGSIKSFGVASIYPGVQVVSSTHVAFIESSTPFMNPSTYVSPAIIAIPSTFACIVVGIVIVGLIFLKVRKPEKKEQLDRRKVNIQQDVKTVDESPYYIEVTNEIEVGLEKNCPAQDVGRRQVEGSSYYSVGNNATTIGLESHTAAHFPSNGVYESGLPAIYINGHIKSIPDFK